MNAKKILFRLGFIFFCTFIAVLGCFFQHKPALAATHVSGYNITVTESAPTMYYGETSPSFDAKLTVPDGYPPINNPGDFYIMVDSQSYAGGGSISGTTPTYLLYLPGVYGTPLSVGQHSVVAVYTPPNQTSIESMPIKLTVLKNTPDLACFISNPSYTYPPNTTLTITMSFSDTNTPVDWQNGTDTISFVGAQTFTSAHLKPNSSNQVTVRTPPVTGDYQLRCIFDGTNSFNSAEWNLDAVVSKNNQPGMKLYANPTTLKAGQSFTWHIVVIGVPGLPVPTGDISISIGDSYTRQIALGSGGSVTVQGTAPSYLDGNAIKVLYFGDSVYTWHIASFPLTNPPLSTKDENAPQPLSTSVVSTNTPNSSLTLRNVAKAVATPTSKSAAKTASGIVAKTASSIATGLTENSTPGSRATRSSLNQGDVGHWVLLGGIISLASSGAVSFVVLRRRNVTAMTKNNKNEL
jgi:hypothetical protein